MNDVTKFNNTFEGIKHIDENNGEYWYTKELQGILDCTTWKAFKKTIKKAKIACNLSGFEVDNNFVYLENDDYKLTRLACYLIMQNCDSKIKAVALAKSYILDRTRKMELLEEGCGNKVETKSLSYEAIKAGVKDLKSFHEAGIKGLYGDKALPFDNMDSAQLGANIFRITQTETRLKRENITNEEDAKRISYEVGKIIRDAINSM